MGRASQLAGRWPRAKTALPGSVGIFLLAPLVYLPGLGPTRMPISFDTVTFFYPLRQYLALAWQHGRWLPLWTSNVYLGVPYLANLQNAVLYPPSLIYALLPTAPAMAYAMVLHVGLAGAGMYWYAYRALRLRFAGSTVTAVIYMLGPYLTAHVTHLNQSNTLAWTPWIMLAVDRTMIRPTRKLVAATAVLVALAFLAGHTQQFYFSLVLALLAAGTAALRLNRPTLRLLIARAATVLGALSFGVVLVGVQLIPTLELVSHSIRRTGLDLTAAGFLSLPLSGVMGSVLPKYSIELPTEYAGASVGAVALLLISIAVVARWRRPLVSIWAAVFVLATWAATGPPGRLYDALFYALPGLRLFRVPSRLLLFSTVAGAILAGYGVLAAAQFARACRRPPWRLRARLLLFGAAGLAAIPVLAAILDRIVGGHLPRVLKMFPHEIGTADLVIVGGFELAGVAFIAVGATVGRRKGYRLVGPALAALTLLDIVLATASIQTRHPLPVSLLSLRPPAAKLVRPDLNSRYLSLYRPPASLDGSVYNGVPSEDRAKYLELLDLALVMRPDIGLSDGPLSADGYDGGILPLQSYVDFRKPVLGPSAIASPDYTIHDLIDRVNDPGWLRSAGVGVLLTDSGMYPASDNCQCFDRIGKLGAVNAWRLSGMPSTRAWEEGPEGRLPAAITSDRGEEVEIRLPDTLGGTLVLADSFYPGWSVAIDGRPGVIGERDGFLRQVTVPPGAQRVVFTYRPLSLLIGLGVTLIGLAALAGLLLVPWRRVA